MRGCFASVSVCVSVRVCACVSLSLCSWACVSLCARGRVGVCTCTVDTVDSRFLRLLHLTALEPDPKEATPFLRFLARTLSNVFPKMGLKELSHDGVCGNPLVVQQYMADPLVYTGGFKVRLASECLEAMDGIMKGNLAAPGTCADTVGASLLCCCCCGTDPSKFTAPLLLVHGSEDAVRRLLWFPAEWLLLVACCLLFAACCLLLVACCLPVAVVRSPPRLLMCLDLPAIGVRLHV